MPQALIVPGRPAADGLTWWVWAEGAPALSLDGPGAARAQVDVHTVATAADPPLARNVRIVTTTGLSPDSAYRLTVTLAGGSTATGASRTLPDAVPPGTPFTFALGSCHCLARDPGGWGAFFPPDPHRDGGPDPVRLRLLCGDQIYMDLTPGGGGPILFGAPDPWDRYRDQWATARYGEFLRRAPTLVMADDHEFWNDYPHANVHLPWSESDRGGPLGAAMDRAYSVFQTALNVAPGPLPAAPEDLATLLRRDARTFGFSAGPLRFFLLDTRTARTRFDASPPRCARPAWLAAALRWLRGLDGPGVLVVSQPLVEDAAGWVRRLTHTMLDVNLPDYAADFAALWDGLFEAPHDVLVLSGDIHWSRVYAVRRAASPGRRVFEVTSSPLAKIPQGSYSRGDDLGKVEWEAGGGLGRWVRRAETGAPSTYSTISLIPRGPLPASGLVVRVAAWGRRAGGAPGAQMIYEDQFQLD